MITMKFVSTLFLRVCCSISTGSSSVHLLSPYQVMQQLFCFSFGENLQQRKKLGVGALFVPSPPCQEKNPKQSPLCSLGDVMSWSHAGGAGIMLQLSLQEVLGGGGGGGGGSDRSEGLGEGGTVSRLHRAGYHTVRGVR